MKKLVIVAETDSTNAELVRRLPLPHGAGVMARRQTQGRGRQGREWQCLEGDLAASFWLTTLGEPLCALPLVGALAVLDALHHLPGGAGLDVRCKWPNDLRVQGGKLAGMLAAYQPEHGGVVFGVGVNLAGEAADFAALGRPVTSFRCATGRVVPPETLFGLLALQLTRRMRRWRREGFEPLRREWLACCDHLGDTVRVHCPDGSLVHGVTTGIGPRGELLLDCDGQTRTVLCGDVEG